MIDTLRDAGTLIPWLALNYYAATLAIWIGHYLPHRAGSRLREFHVDGHHRLYRDSSHARSATFKYASGRNDSLVPIMPWVVVDHSWDRVLGTYRAPGIAGIRRCA